MTETVRIHRHAQGGFALTELVPWAAGVLVLLASLWLLSSGDDPDARIDRDASRALALARTGVARAIEALDRGEAVDPLSGEDSNGRFRVVATETRPGRYRVECTGVVGDVERRATVTVQAAPTGHRSSYRHGFASAESIELGDGTTVESTGASRDHARLTANAAVYVGANAAIRGVVQSSAQEGFFLHESSRHVGEHVATGTGLLFPPPAEAEFTAALHANRNRDIRATRGTFDYDPATLALSVKRGAVIELPAGVYLFSSLRLAPASWIVVTGETKVYVTGDLDCSGGTIINRTLAARNLEIVAYPYDLGVLTTPDDPTARLGGGPASALTVYAPGHDVTLRDDGTTFSGAVTAKSLTVRNMHLRFDPTLETAAPAAPAGLGTPPRHVELERHEDPGPATP